LPASWTDVDGPDPFLVLSAGRSHFRADDLLQLATLVRALSGGVCQADFAVGVRRISPLSARGAGREVSP
jgi:hypothetical protein